MNQERAKTDIIIIMRENAVYIYMDWAMKIIPASRREDQSSWFGKCGIPWHISIVYNKIAEDVYRVRYFVHIFDVSSQDSEA